jgi:hypothetical protein
MRGIGVIGPPLVAAVTVAVGDDVAGVEPLALLAVTVTSIVSPRSPDPSVYVLPVAPEIATQSAPLPLQSLHLYAKPVGLFDHEPSLADNVSPTTVVPEITGTAVFTGAAGGGVPTTLVATDDADPDPPALLAVTVTTNVCDSSAATTLYVPAVAPAIATHDPPLALQSLHAYAKPVGPFDHEPSLADNVSPTATVPEITGRPESTGAAGGPLATTPVATDDADPDPPALLAVTVTTNVCDSSAATTVYVLAVAPAIATHDAPLALQSLHAYAKPVGPFDHEPSLADNVSPTAAVPDTTGTPELTGAAGTTTPVGADITDANAGPAALLASTTTTTVSPTSPAPNT